MNPATELVMRPPVDTDADEITEMLRASDISIVGEPWFELENLMEDWQQPNFDKSVDAVVTQNADGKIIGYESVFHVSENGPVQIDGYTHPEYLGQGVGTRLLAWAEQRAKARAAAELPAGTPAKMRANTFGNEERGRALLLDNGFSIVRHFYRMQITFNEAPPDPKLPADVVIRPFIPGQDEHATWQTVTDAFQDHWGSAPIPFEEWVTRTTAPGFDPTLWFLAEATAADGSKQIAGVSLSLFRNGEGWVRTLGVLREHRKRGLGEALLYHNFGEFYRRGMMTVGLGVDAQSPTGATRLYERVGMRPKMSFDTFEKPLSHE